LKKQEEIMTHFGKTSQIFTAALAIVFMIFTACSLPVNSIENKGNSLPPPPSPLGLSAQTVESSCVELSWNSVSSAASYALYRSPDNEGAYTHIKTLRAPADSYTDGSVESGKRYYYRLTVMENNAGEGAPSASVCALTMIPPPPDTVSLEIISASGIKVTWNTVPGAESYTVYRSTDGTSYTELAGNLATTEYSDTGGISLGGIYYYKVTAKNGLGEGARSTGFNVTVAVPAVPTGLSAAPAADLRGINLNWTASAGAASYKVYRSLSSGGPFDTLGTSPSASYTDADAPAGTT
jgi:fibronectin type 3 domain-containing protein